MLISSLVSVCLHINSKSVFRELVLVIAVAVFFPELLSSFKPWLHTPTKFVELHAHASRECATPHCCGSQADAASSTKHTML